MNRYKFADLLRSGCSTSFVGLFEVVKVAVLFPAFWLTVTRGLVSNSLWSWLLLDWWFEKSFWDEGDAGLLTRGEWTMLSSSSNECKS